MNSEFSITSKFELRDLCRVDLDKIKISSLHEGKRFTLIDGDNETKEYAFTDIYKEVKALSNNTSNTHASLLKLHHFVIKLQEVKVHSSSQGVFDFETPAKKLGKLERNLQEKISVIEKLFSAAKSGDVEVLKHLAKKGVDFNIRVDGATPLGLAVINGHTKAVEILIDAGAYVNFQNSAGIPPLFYVLKDENVEILKLLIEKKVNLNFQDKKGRTILIRAAKDGRKEIVATLIKNKLEINLRDHSGQRALDRAWIKGDKDIVDLLLPFAPEGDRKLTSAMPAMEISLEKQEHFGQFI